MKHLFLTLLIMMGCLAHANAQAPLTGFDKQPPEDTSLVEPSTPPAAIDQVIESQAPAATTAPARPVIDSSPIQGSKEPLEITAQDTLEWRRANKRMIARGKALAVQGASSVAASTLTADYRESDQSNFEIHTLTADQNVVLKSQTDTAYGDHAVYDLDKGLATLTGQNLRLVSPDQTITARDRFEYWVNTGKVHAIGDALVVRPKPEGGQDTLRADKITATLKKDANGKQSLDTIEAFDNVVITTPTEKVTGTYGIYRANTNIAELTGGVTITRGPNVLTGNRAEVDLNTNISKIFADQSSGGRVKATFFPGSEK